MGEFEVFMFILVSAGLSKKVSHVHAFRFLIIQKQLALSFLLADGSSFPRRCSCAK